MQTFFIMSKTDMKAKRNNKTKIDHKIKRLNILHSLETFFLGKHTISLNKKTRVLHSIIGGTGSKIHSLET